MTTLNEIRQKADDRRGTAGELEQEVARLQQREQDLLEANNRYLDRARSAEALLRELGRKVAPVPGVTAAQLADALGCFWNTAIGIAHDSQNPSAYATIGAMAEGIAAVQKRLTEIAKG